MPVSCNADVTYEEVRDLFDYDGENLIWRKRRGRVAAGSIAGTIGNRGYRVIFVNMKPYVAHRLIWLWWHGKWPQEEIDHKNHNKLDNRVDNLREATSSQGNANTVMSRRNSSGYKGVHWSGWSWCSSISCNGKAEHLGSFETKEEAYEAYCKRAKELFGDFACLGTFLGEYSY